MLEVLKARFHEGSSGVYGLQSSRREGLGVDVSFCFPNKPGK